MKKLFSILIALMTIISLLGATASASAAPEALLTPTPELGQLKVCKVAGSGVTQGMLFTFQVNGQNYSVPAGPPDRGYCVLAGQYPVGSEVTVQESIPNGYYVSRIVVKPDRTVSKDTTRGLVTVRIVSGVIETIYTNKVAGTPTPTRTPTSVHTSTPRPTRTPTSTPSCAPNCTPTSTPVPKGRMQICKEAEDPGVTGYFTFRFETNRSRQVPVGACAGLISVDAGILTVTEVAQTGYTVADIYTIPADRLISKDLNAGSARIRIVEGEAASQTIVIFRNRSVTGSATSTSTATPTLVMTATHTPTGTITPATSTHTATPTFVMTATSTPTGTITPFTSTPTFTPTGSATATFTPTSPACPPLRVSADFSKVPVGQSVEGMGKVAPNLNIQATSPGNPNAEALRVVQAPKPEDQGLTVYLSTNDGRARNGGLVGDGGFSDVSTRNLRLPHEYTFTFAAGVTVSDFRLHMLDYGDLNEALATNHVVRMSAYRANESIPFMTQELSYTTPPDRAPRSSDKYGDLWFSGDAVGARGGSASRQQPGNWTWDISGTGIHHIILSFPEGYDPNIAFDLLSFTESQACVCQSANTADYFANFNSVGINQSVEGMGKVAPFLNIQATSPGNPNAEAVRVVQAPQLDLGELIVYLSPNDGGAHNGGLVADGGFSDVSTRALGQAHEYTFTFETGVTVSSFRMQMLDYGDLNEALALNHRAVMTAYDVNGNQITTPGATQVLSFTTPPDLAPRSSDKYGDLWLSGDASSARGAGLPDQQPGNWTWKISGIGIHSIVLRFPAGHDPNIAFNRVYYSIECGSLP